MNYGTIKKKEKCQSVVCVSPFPQAMNWLLRSVVQQVALHDLLWFFVDSLVPQEEEEEVEEEGGGGDDKKKERPKKDMEVTPWPTIIFVVHCHPTDPGKWPCPHP